MNRKTILVLFIIFGTLIVAATIPWWTEYSGSKEDSISTTGIDLSLFTEGDTDKILIKKKGEETRELIRVDGKWKINGHDASRKEISGLFRDLKVLRVNTLASKNPDNHKRFDVTKETGYLLTFTRGSKTRTFIIGKDGPLYGSFYIRKKSQNDVYLVTSPLRRRIMRGESPWRDKVVVNIQEEAVNKIEIRSRDNPLIITRSAEGKWIAKGIGDKRVELDEKTTSRLFSALNPLEATGFLNEKEKKDFIKRKDKITLRIYGPNSQSIAEIELLKKSNDWWARVRDRELLYRIPSFRLSDVILKYDDMFKKGDKNKNYKMGQ